MRVYCNNELVCLVTTSAKARTTGKLDMTGLISCRTTGMYRQHSIELAVCDDDTLLVLITNYYMVVFLGINITTGG